MIKFLFDEVEDLSHLSIGLVDTQVGHQESFPAREGAVGVFCTFLILVGDRILLGFAQLDVPRADLTPDLECLELGTNQTQLPRMPACTILGAILESLVVLATPIDPEVVWEIPCAALVAAKDVGDHFTMIAGVCKTSRNCYAFLVFALRWIIVDTGNLCTIVLQTVSTDADSVISSDHSADLSSIAIAVITATPIADTVTIVDVLSVCSPSVFHFEVLLFRIVSIYVENVMATRSGTDLSSVIIAIRMVTPINHVLNSNELLNACSPRVPQYRVLLLRAVSKDVDDAVMPRSGADLDPIMSGIIGMNAACLVILDILVLYNVRASSILIVFNAGCLHLRRYRSSYCH